MTTANGKKTNPRLPKLLYDPTRELLALMGMSAAAAVNLLREEMIRNPVAKKFVAYWDDQPKNKKRAGRIDLCCREAGIPADEIRGILVRIYITHKQELSAIIQINAMPDIVQVSTDEAKKSDNFNERQKHLESRGIITQPQGGGIHVTTQIATLQPTQEQKGLPDFDEHMRQVTSGQKQLSGEVVDAEIVDE